MTNDPVEIMKAEERMMGRPCRLVASPQVVAQEDETMLIVYDAQHERRWAVYVNGKHSGGGIVSTRSGGRA